MIPNSEPYQKFHEIFEHAMQLPKEFFPEPNAMTLATSTAEGKPSARIVLLKGYDERGFVFYTNFEGRKGGELLSNPNAALCFHWAPLGVQIRVEGRVEEVTGDEADAYFASRARASRIGAWASEQSRPMADPDDLHNRVDQFTRKFEGMEVPRPPHWSGFRVVPQLIEFWTAGDSRLHDRKVYRKNGDVWKIETLYP